MKQKSLATIILLTIFVSLSLTTHASSVEHMRGFYWMTALPQNLTTSTTDFEKYLQRIESVLQTNSYIEGLHLIVPWDKVEVAAEEYRFERLDQVINLAVVYGKKYKLAFLPGVATPDYVYAQGAEEFNTIVVNSNRADYGETIRLPLPWDTIYQSAFFRVTEKLAERYSYDYNLVAISCVGANFLSGEMHLPRTKIDMEKWENYPNYQNEIEQAWIDFLDHFATLFPQQQITLALAVPLPGMKWHVEQIINHGIDNYPERFTLESAQLHGRNDNTKISSYQLLMEYQNWTNNGFQNLAGWQYPRSTKRQGSMEMTILNYIRADAEYMELWYGDGANIQTCEKLNEIYTRALNMGHDEFKNELIEQGLYTP